MSTEFPFDISLMLLILKKAIVGSDSLHSLIEYNIKLFDDKNMLEAQKNIFTEQGKLLTLIYLKIKEG